MRLRWEVFVVAGGLVLLGLGIYLARRRRELGRRLGDEDDTAAALSAAVDDSLDDLRAERDPRRAVIAAYARMERVLERHGFARDRAEAPLEYLARVLRGLRVRSSAVLALTELFERAKFSVHEIDAEMKEEAIGALSAVRDDLRTAT
jgi:LPXTG-motif cell wall-anchored protein